MSIRSLTLLLLVVLLAVVAEQGCAVSPQVKRSAQTLSPTPPDGTGEPLGQGRLRLQGGFSSAAVQTQQTTNLGDAGLHVPTTQAQGGLRVGLSRIVDIGVRGVWASYDDSEPSTVGTAPLGRREQDSWAAGPTVHLGIPLGDGRASIGMTLETLWASLPYAVWICRTCSEPLPYRQYQELYDLDEEGREHFLMFNGAVTGSYRFAPHPVVLFAGAGLHSTVRNIGFDEERNTDSTLEKGEPIGLLFGGVELGLGQHFNVTLEGYAPMGQQADEGQVFGPGLELSLGLLL